MGIISVLIGWLQYHLGLRTDTPDNSGSLHAKLGDLKNFTDAKVDTIQKPRGYGNRGQYSTSATSYQTVLNIYGRGCLKLLHFRQNSNPEYSMGVEIYIDGNRVFYGSAPTGTKGTMVIGLKGDGYDLTMVPGTDPRVNFNFNNNLRINVRSAIDLGTVYAYWYYELE